jgi:hypothetical protein
MRGTSLVLVLVLVLVGVVGCGSVPAAPDAAAELCFDGEDNDGNGMADCADPGCDPAAVCVASSADQPAGVLVDAGADCPAGYTEGETIHRGLQPSDCAGCGCAVGDTICEAQVWTYNTDTNECFNDAGLTGGLLIGFPITQECSTKTMGFPFIYGARVNIEVADRTCTPSGSGAPGPTTWAESKKFCIAPAAAAGCATGEACVARAASADDQCAIAQGASTCEGFGSSEEWYTDVDDQRVCGACFCTAVGGDCDNTQVWVGHDFSCGTEPYALINDDEKNCFGMDYSPPAQVVGTPTPPSGCTASAPLSGDITPTGETTLCCAPSS